MSGSKPENTASTSNIMIVICTCLCILLIAVSIKIYYREPHQRAPEVCMPMYKIYNLVWVDAFRIIWYDDPVSHIKHSQDTQRFYSSCVKKVKKWKWLKSF